MIMSLHKYIRLYTQMLSFFSKPSICQQTIQKAFKYSVTRLFASAKETKVINESVKNKEIEKPIEKQLSKKEMELPDFPEFPHIRADFEAGIRSREYLKNRPTEKRIDMLHQKPGSVVYFDDEEFKYYFPHE